MSLQRFDAAAFRERLQLAISITGMPMPRVALACAMPLASLEGYAYGQMLPGAKALAQLSQGLNVSTDWLLFGGRNARRVA